jgi:hypothetical protein
MSETFSEPVLADRSGRVVLLPSAQSLVDGVDRRQIKKMCAPTAHNYERSRETSHALANYCTALLSRTKSGGISRPVHQVDTMTRKPNEKCKRSKSIVKKQTHTHTHAEWGTRMLLFYPTGQSSACADDEHFLSPVLQIHGFSVCDPSNQ